MKYVGHSEYGRKPLDNYSTSELQAEIERRQIKEDNRKEVEKAMSDMQINLDQTKMLKKTEHLHKTIYEIEVRTL